MDQDNKEKLVDTPADTEASQKDARVKKVKEHPDDTSSFEGAALLPETAARRAKRARRHAFRNFTKNNYAMWRNFNLIILLASVIFGVGNYYMLKLNSDSHAASNCGGLRGLSQFDYGYNSVNFLIGIINLTGLNNKICTANVVTILIVLELGCLAYKQFVYFKAQ